LTRTRAVAYLVASAVLWSTGGVLIKWVSWHPLAICGARSAIAAALLWLLLRRPRFTWSVPQIGGALAYAATVLLYVSAVKMTTAANAILLQYTAPVWVALFGASFLGERATRLDWLSVVLSLGGLVVFFREGLAGQFFWGDLLAALSGVTMAWMSLFLRKQKDGSPIESVLLGNIAAALVGVPFMVRGWPDAQGWLGIVLLGVVQLGLSYVLYTAAIRRVAALEAIVVSMLEPILNPVWVALLLGERPGPGAVAGGTLVLGAIALRIGHGMGLRARRSQTEGDVLESSRHRQAGDLAKSRSNPRQQSP